jgi:predicted AlkP superfamily phosphohydrolase/phosphomutase
LVTTLSGCAMPATALWLAGVRRKTALLRHLLALNEWDLFCGVFSESHCAGHQFWHFADPGHPRYDPGAPQELQTAIRDVYQAIDTGLAALLEGLGPDRHVLLLLSHGMGPWHDGSHLLDPVLDRLGLGVAKGEPRSAPARGAYQARRLIWRLGRHFPAALQQEARTRLPDAVWRLWKWTHPDIAHGWRSRRAFAVPGHSMTGGIRINLAGREPCGRVQPGAEYDALCRDLAEALRALENADTGKPAVQWVAHADTLYQGPHVSEMPDLFVEWEHSAPILTVRSARVGTVSGNPRGHRTGEHREGGLLAGLGPRFRSGEVGTAVFAQDLAPTMLGFFGLEAPPTSEGRSILPLLAGA